MELLQEREEGGYPTEYLVARVRGRSAAILKDWDALLGAPETLAGRAAARAQDTAAVRPEDMPWHRLAGEYEWLYRQMNPGLRETFRPFFTYRELRNLVLALRYRWAHDEERVREVLARSLLSTEVKRLTRESGDLSACLTALGAVLTRISERFSGLEALASQRGLDAVEQRIIESYLEHTAALPLHPALRVFFQYAVDARNIISLAKHLRWNMQAPLPFISGGSLAKPAFFTAGGRRSGEDLAALVRRLTGRTPEQLIPAAVEQALLQGLTKLLRSAARKATAPEVILDYLWRCFLEARNMGVLLSGKDLEREVLSRELVI